MRIVLDTNVLVSALLSRDGPPGRLLAAVKRGDVTLITSEEQLQELHRVLGRLNAQVRPDEAESLVDGLRAVGVIATDLPDVDDSPDPDDNPILATAIAGGADVIVSGDKKHMLLLGRVGEIPGEIPIVTARDALNWLPGGE